MRTIMLQGYLHEANFGDVLYGHLFYDKCSELGFEEIDFYQYKDLGIGEHCRNEYKYFSRKSALQCLKSDAFVIISGGSLWDNGKSELNAKIRYKRFIRPALLFQMLGKPVYVLGVGGSAVETPFLRKKMIKMLNKAEIVQFRDRATKAVFDGYGVKNSTVTADTALVFTRDMLPPFAEKEKLDSFASGRKKILFHLPDGVDENNYMSSRIVPALICFLKEHTDYSVVVSHDNIRFIPDDEKAAIQSIFEQFEEAQINAYRYNYHDSRQMCSLIDNVDCIITAKLHVGVLGCVLNKCVISFPVAVEKTNNFYAMIDESERCVHMDSVTVEKAYDQICRFHEKPVFISEELIRAANKNLDALAHIRNTDRKCKYGFFNRKH